MLERIELIRAHGPRARGDLDDVVLEAATLHWLEIIGEAASRVSEDVRSRHPEVPWRPVIDFRNLIAHGYDIVEPDRVWAVVASDLARLEAQIRTILDELR